MESSLAFPTDPRLAWNLLFLMDTDTELALSRQHPPNAENSIRGRQECFISQTGNQVTATVLQEMGPEQVCLTPEPAHSPTPHPPHLHSPLHLSVSSTSKERALLRKSLYLLPHWPEC